MTELWLIPDPDEPEFDRRSRQMPALPIMQRREIAYRVRMAQSASRGERKATVELIGRSFGISGRAAYRYARHSYPCPGSRCMTNVRGGGLCSFCSRTPPESPVAAKMGTSRVELRDARIPSGLPVVLNPSPGGRSASSRLRR